MKQVLLSWSSGKDSAWSLQVLRQDPGLTVVGLLTTLNEAFDRVAMHAVRRELLEAQAEAAGLPLETIRIPWPCSNEQGALVRARLVIAVTLDLFGDSYVCFIDLLMSIKKDLLGNKCGCRVECKKAKALFS